jgi:hypothetical protein
VVLGPAPHTLRLAGDELELSRDGASGRETRFRRDGDGRWRGLDGYMAGEPLREVTGTDRQVVALDVGSFIYSRTPCDLQAPIPGGIAPDSWHAQVAGLTAGHLRYGVNCHQALVPAGVDLVIPRSLGRTVHSLDVAHAPADLRLGAGLPVASAGRHL